VDKPIIGWFCTYTPVEILEAAGLTPYGIREDSGKGHEDVYLGDSICSYVRSCIGGALTGSYDFLDGIVIAHSCECMRRLYDIWAYKQTEIKPKCVFFLDVPRINTPSSVEYFAKNIQRFKEAIEERYGKISEQNLLESINKYNRTRELFHQIHQLRKADSPALSGVCAAQLVEKSMTSPRDQYNAELASLLATLNDAGEENFSGRPRVMIYGGLANPRLVEAVEEAGGVVVCENTCNGLRQFGEFSDSVNDPLRWLSKYYLSKPPCPRMIGEHGMSISENLKTLAREYNVDGIIYYSIKFCANIQMGWPIIRDELSEKLPIKILEGDSSSEINERELQSFVKKLRGRNKRDAGTNT
jgi:benzoyl-CoA reductase/2-hydroxyglutaryl-CoA dehydratase subunit BcrC/BadD/HgdB